MFSRLPWRRRSGPEDAGWGPLAASLDLSRIDRAQVAGLVGLDELTLLEPAFAYDGVAGVTCYLFAHRERLDARSGKQLLATSACWCRRTASRPPRGGPFRRCTR